MSFDEICRFSDENNRFFFQKTLDKLKNDNLQVQKIAMIFHPKIS